MKVPELADFVGPNMAILICGLNPSIYSAQAGVGFARPGNRFWPAALAAGIVSIDRDPDHALEHHGIGMTDLVKRATRRADELDPQEYRNGLCRLEGVVTRWQPTTVCFVGLAGWRAAVDRKAKAGWQTTMVADRPVYLMPSTSGLNAHSSLSDLTEHLKAASRNYCPNNR
ncbi:MAG: mismatch-specific DNA-glycosylase [Acidimicrobiales bacterium]